MLGRLAETLFPVQRGERSLTFALFLHSFFAVGAFMTGRTVRDALFMANHDRGALPWMYIASAIAVTLFGLAYAPLAKRFRRDQLALATALVFSAVFCALWVLERGQLRGVYAGLYVYVEVMGAIALVQFWTLANDLFHAREAKRLYGLIGAGGTVANVVVGYLIGKLSVWFGASSLMLLCALLLVGTAFAAFAAGRLGRQRSVARKASGKAPATRKGGAARVLTSSHLRTVAVLAALTFFTTTLVDYEFKVIAAQTYPTDQLAAYFGYFNAVIGVLALGLQLFGTNRLLGYAGVIGALSVLPVSIALGSSALTLFPALWAATATRGADSLFRYTVNDATTQILYLPVEAHARAPAKAFIDTVVKPAAIGLAGVALAGYRSGYDGDPYRLAPITLALALLWIGVVASLRSQYVRSLQDNLRRRKLDLASARHRVVDGSTSKVLQRAMESGDAREVLNALELLPHLENIELDHQVEPLLEHPLPEIRVAALDYYARRQTVRFANSIFRRFDDPDPEVRAAAIDAFCAMGRDKAVRNVRRFLSDPDAGVRSAAITGMIRYGGLDGVLMAAEALKGMIEHADPLMREHAAKVLGDIGVRNFYQPVLQLMSDPEPAVRRQATIAAGVLKSPEFVIPLLYKTQAPETLHEAVESLAQYGSGILPTLAKVLSNHLEDAAVRRAVARVLGRLGTPEAVQVMAGHLEERDEQLRARLFRSLARAVKGKASATVPPQPLAEALDGELQRAFNALQALETLGLVAKPLSSAPRQGPEAAGALLASALEEKLAMIERRVFYLLAVLYPDADMEHIYAGIHDADPAEAPRRRANAVELIDNLLDRGLKRRLLPLIEDLPRAERLKALAEVFPQRAQGRDEVLNALCTDESAWVRACAVWYAAETRASASTLFVSLSSDQNPIVRETSLVALAQVAPEEAPGVAQRRLTDEVPVVRQQAARISTRAGSTG